MYIFWCPLTSILLLLHLHGVYLLVSTHFHLVITTHTGCISFGVHSLPSCYYYTYRVYIFWCSLTSILLLLHIQGVYLLVSTHFHLVITTSTGCISFGVHSLPSCYYYTYRVYIFWCPFTSILLLLHIHGVYLFCPLTSILLLLHIRVYIFWCPSCYYYTYRVYIFWCPHFHLVITTPTGCISFGVHSLPSCYYYTYRVYIFWCPLTSILLLLHLQGVYLLVSTHFHLVITTPTGCISFGVHSLPSCYYYTYRVYIFWCPLTSILLLLHLQGVYLLVSTHFHLVITTPTGCISFGVHSLPSCYYYTYRVYIFWCPLTSILLLLHLQGVYLLVSTHFHLVITTPTGCISFGVHSLPSCYYYTYRVYIFWCPLTSILLLLHIQGVYLLVSTHFHLVITTPTGCISFGVHSLPSCYYYILQGVYLLVSTHFHLVITTPTWCISFGVHSLPSCYYYTYRVYIFWCPFTSILLLLHLQGVPLTSILLLLHLQGVYLLVSTHFHLVITTPTGCISFGVHSLPSCYYYTYRVYIFWCPLTSILLLLHLQGVYLLVSTHFHLVITTPTWCISFGVHSLPSCYYYTYRVYIFWCPLTSILLLLHLQGVYLLVSTHFHLVITTPTGCISFGVHSLPSCYYTYRVYIFWCPLTSILLLLHLHGVYLLVSTHFHLVITTPTGCISFGVHSLPSCYYYTYRVYIFWCPLTSILLLLHLQGVYLLVSIHFHLVITTHTECISFGVHSLPSCYYYTYRVYIFWCPLTSILLLLHILFDTGCISSGVHSLPSCYYYTYMVYIFWCPLTSILLLLHIQGVYLLVSIHFHLVITTPTGCISFGVHSLPSCYYYTYRVYIFWCPLTSILLLLHLQGVYLLVSIHFHLVITTPTGCISFGVHSLPSRYYYTYRVYIFWCPLTSILLLLHLQGVYLLVSTHFHLVITTPTGCISFGVHSLPSCYYYTYRVYIFWCPLTSILLLHLQGVYLLVSTHFHLVITTPTWCISFGVHSLPSCYYYTYRVYIFWCPLTSILLLLHLQGVYLLVSTHFHLVITTPTGCISFGVHSLPSCYYYTYRVYIFWCPLTSILLLLHLQGVYLLVSTHFHLVITTHTV